MLSYLFGPSYIGSFLGWYGIHVNQLFYTGQVEEALIESCFVVLGSATQVYMVTPVPAKAGTTTTTTNTACISRHTHPHINNHCRFFGSITTPSSLLENMEHCFNFETSWVEAICYYRSYKGL